jgi:hypothetical protein
VNEPTVVVLGGLTKKQREAIARIEQPAESPIMFMQSGSILLHFVEPKTGNERLVELNIEADDGIYKATIFGNEAREVLVDEHDADDAVIALFRRTAQMIGEVISKSKRS